MSTKYRKQKNKREGGVVSRTSSCATYELQAWHDRTIFDIVQHADQRLESQQSISDWIQYRGLVASMNKD